MNNNVYDENLKAVLLELTRARDWLMRSFDKCQSIDTARSLTDEQFDHLEAYASRFARLSDLLIQKVFRAIDTAEFETTGTIIDSLNRAEKRGLIPDVSDLREIRELRNRISHEYASDKLAPLLKRIRTLTPILLNIIQTTLDYYEKKLKNQ